MDGSNGNLQLRDHGITFSEFKSRNPQLITSWEIEHSLCGLELQKVEYCISPHTLMRIWLEVVMQITTRTLFTREDTLSGSMFIMVTQKHKPKHKYMSNGRNQKTV